MSRSHFTEFQLELPIRMFLFPAERNYFEQIYSLDVQRKIGFQMHSMVRAHRVLNFHFLQRCRGHKIGYLHHLPIPHKFKLHCDQCTNLFPHSFMIDTKQSYILRSERMECGQMEALKCRMWTIGIVIAVIQLFNDRRPHAAEMRLNWT